MKGPKVGCLFPIHFLSSPNLSLPLVSYNSTIVDYQCLGHPNSNVLYDMLKYGFLGNKHTPSLNVVHFDCISCKLGKSKILSFSTHHPNVTQPFDIIHSNYFPLSNSFMLMFKPNFLPKSKSFALIMEGNIHHTHFKNSCNPMTLYLKGHVHQPYNKMGHLLDVVRTLLFESHVPSRFLCKALSIVVHLINRLSSPSLGNESPFNWLFGHPLDYSTLCIFVFIHKNIPSSMHNLFNILFLVILLIKRAFCVMILTFIGFRGPQDNFLVVTLIQEPKLAPPRRMSCPPSIKPLGSKFMFSIKFCSDGSIDRYKAWLIVHGNKQEYGLDYDETFAPIAMTIVCSLLTLAASQSWPLHQMDVKNAFLHSDLKEEVYIKLPYAMHTPSSNTICKLKHSLYGSKQAPRYDPSFFLQRNLKGIMVLLVYVDDIVVTSSDQKHPKDIFLNKQKYIQDLIQLFGLTNSTPVDTPLEVNEGDILDDHTLYRKLVGSLIYVTITHLDISFVVHTVSKYLLGTSTCGLFFPTNSSLNLQKQDSFSKSSTKVEYHATFTACYEIIWLRGLLIELRFPQAQPTPLHVDNTSYIHIVANPIYHEQMKHIEVDCHSIREAYDCRVINLPHLNIYSNK
ncbi:hypothetical protein CR513_36657, partial [Mucuna pruriens]